MRRSEEVQFNLSGLIIQSKVIINSRFQRKKKTRNAWRKGENAIFLSGEPCAAVFGLETPRGQKKLREEAAATQGHGDKKKKKNESVERSNSFPLMERDGNAELWQQQGG